MLRHSIIFMLLDANAQFWGNASPSVVLSYCVLVPVEAKTTDTRGLYYRSDITSTDTRYVLCASPKKIFFLFTVKTLTWNGTYPSKIIKVSDGMSTKLVYSLLLSMSLTYWSIRFWCMICHPNMQPRGIRCQTCVKTRLWPSPFYECRANQWLSVPWRYVLKYMSRQWYLGKKRMSMDEVI